VQTFGNYKGYEMTTVAWVSLDMFVLVFDSAILLYYLFTPYLWHW